MKLETTQYLLQLAGKELTKALSSVSMDLKELTSAEFIQIKSLTLLLRDCKAIMLIMVKKLIPRALFNILATREKVT